MDLYFLTGNFGNWSIIELEENRLIQFEAGVYQRILELSTIIFMKGSMYRLTVGTFRTCITFVKKKIFKKCFIMQIQ